MNSASSTALLAWLGKANTPDPGDLQEADPAQHQQARLTEAPLDLDPLSRPLSAFGLSLYQGTFL